MAVNLLCMTTTIEIYSSMSKERLISVLLNKQSGRWSRQSEVFAVFLRITGGSVSMARCHGFPRVTRLFLKRQGHRELEFGCRRPMGTSCRTCACADTFPTSTFPGRTGSSQHTSGSAYLCHHGPKGIDRNDWLKWKSFVKTSCDWNNTEMTCAVLLATTLVWTKAVQKKSAAPC